MLMQQPSQTLLVGGQREWLDPSNGAYDLGSILSVVRRQIWMFLTVSILSLIAGMAYILLSDPLYTATSSILINTRAARAIEGVSGPMVLGTDKNDNYIDNQVEFIRSDSIALSVARELNLAANPIFIQESLQEVVTKTVKGMLNRWIDGPVLDPPSLQDVEISVVTRLQEGLDVRRVTNTSVIDVHYTTFDPNLAAQIASAYASAFLQDQNDTRIAMSKRARAWLEERVDELSKKSLDAAVAIQIFRVKNNLVTADGKFITDQQMSELNTQLTLARAEVARTEARHARIQSILDAGRADAMVGAALEDPVVNNLRGKFLDASKREAEMSLRLGPDHIQAATLREEMRQYERLILGELKRIADTYRNDFDIAKAREQSLRDSLTSLADISAAENSLMPKLREMERQADTLRTLHKDLMQRFQEGDQLESFPKSEARVITQASPPLSQSSPRRLLSLVAFLAGGAMLGAGLGLVRDFNDHSLRSRVQVRDGLGAEFLGNLPKVKAEKDRRPPADAIRLSERREFQSPPMMRYVAQAPLSIYAETLRRVKVAADLALADESSKVIGVTSVLTGEGKSMTAKNFASLLALQGARTLLIDADLRYPALTSAIAPFAEGGLLEALLEETSAETLVLREVDTGLSFLPAAKKRLHIDAGSLLSSTQMRELLYWARKKFDYTVIDLPPIGPVVDVRASASLLSTLLVVAEWGRTPSKLVREMVLSDKVIHECCLGIILNKVNMKDISKYDNLDIWGTEKPKNYRKYYRDS